MLGRGHSLSGAAVFLGATGYHTITTGEPVDPAFLVMGTSIMSGAGLIPDLDSYTATVTRSYGIFGRILYNITNGLSLLIYNATATRKDDDIENGHRTLTHTLVFAIVSGLAVWGLTTIPGSLTFFGEEYTLGQFFSLLLMAFLLHLGTAGLFAPQLKKAKNKLGLFAPYILMAFSVLVTFVTSRFLPPNSMPTEILAILVGVGIFVHILGDTITKKGTPLLWPLKIRGKRWYDIALPAFLRITAGGPVELKILVPLFTVICVLGVAAQIVVGVGIL